MTLVYSDVLYFAVCLIRMCLNKIPNNLLGVYLLTIVGCKLLEIQLPKGACLWLIFL